MCLRAWKINLNLNQSKWLHIMSWYYWAAVFRYGWNVFTNSKIIHDVKLHNFPWANSMSHFKVKIPSLKQHFHCSNGHIVCCYVHVRKAYKACSIKQQAFMLNSQAGITGVPLSHALVRGNQLYWIVLPFVCQGELNHILFVIFMLKWKHNNICSIKFYAES